MANETEYIYVENLFIPFVNKEINTLFLRGLNYLKGNNGSGKTLLLDYIAGLRKNSEVKISGNESIIYINQSIFFSDRLSALDFLKFVVRLDGKQQSIKSFLPFMEQFEHGKHTTEINNILDKQWGMLSGGEKKFIYTVILLYLERQWYILDEPFAFVDSEKKKIIWKIIEHKIATGKGIILTSHEDDLHLVKYQANIVSF